MRRWMAVWIAAVLEGVAASRLSAAGAALAVAESSTLTNGLVLYYTFDADEGLIIRDHSRHGNHGTATNVRWSEEGVPGRALVFHGQGSLVTVPHSPTLDLSGGFTVAAWIKTTQATSPNGRMDFLSKRNLRHVNYALFVEVPDGGVGFWVWDGQGTMGEGPRRSWVSRKAARANDGAWHHLVGVRESNAVLRVYLDGMLLESVADGSAGPVRNTEPLRLGHDGYNADFFEGWLDEIRIYARPLSGVEVAVLAAGTGTLSLSSEEAKTIVVWVEKLAAADPAVRREARKRLKALGRRAWPILLRYRDDPDPEIRLSVRELIRSE